MIASGQSSGSTSGLVTGLFRRLIDLALQDDLLALDAAGLAAAVEEVDVAELPQRIGELASTWVAKALADVHEDDRPAAAQQLATELMATINRTAADPLLAQDEALASPISELTAIEPTRPHRQHHPNQTAAHPDRRHRAAHQRTRRADPEQGDRSRDRLG